jgi:hypothetical protein
VKRKWLVLGGVALLFVVLFLGGFASAWVSARRDQHTCKKLAPPPGAHSVHVRHDGDTRLCVWVRANGSTLRVRTLP